MILEEYKTLAKASSSTGAWAVGSGHWVAGGGVTSLSLIAKPIFCLQGVERVSRKSTGSGKEVV